MLRNNSTEQSSRGLWQKVLWRQCQWALLRLSEVKDYIWYQTWGFSFFKKFLLFFFPSSPPHTHTFPLQIAGRLLSLLVGDSTLPSNEGGRLLFELKTTNLCRIVRKTHFHSSGKRIKGSTKQTAIISWCGCVSQMKFTLIRNHLEAAQQIESSAGSAPWQVAYHKATPQLPNCLICENSRNYSHCLMNCAHTDTSPQYAVLLNQNVQFVSTKICKFARKLISL